MTTYYHTPLEVSSGLTTLSLNRSLGELDFAIRQLAYWELDWEDIVTKPATPPGGYANVYIRGGRLIVLGDDGVERAIHLRDQYACIIDQKSNADGGDASAATWHTRDLNTIIANPFGIISLSSNQLTLQPGTYRARASAPAMTGGDHLIRLKDVTTGTTLIGGIPLTGGTSQTYSTLAGGFVLTDEVAVELQHYFVVAQAGNGLGEGSSFSESIFSVVELWKR